MMIAKRSLTMTLRKKYRSEIPSLCTYLLLHNLLLQLTLTCQFPALSEERILQRRSGKAPSLRHRSQNSSHRLAALDQPASQTALLNHHILRPEAMKTYGATQPMNHCSCHAGLHAEVCILVATLTRPTEGYAAAKGLANLVSDSAL